jgi:hypothetical protein
MASKSRTGLPVIVAAATALVAAFGGGLSSAATPGGEAPPAAEATAPSGRSVDPRLVDSRRLAAEFQQALGAELKAALASGGPVAAIAVCNEMAPGIAARLSSGADAQVSRTALRLRNPDNAPDPAARQVLEGFRARLAAGVADPPLEHFAVRPDGSVRYMKTIVTQPMCVACHGERLAPAVEAAIAQRYPQDQATGFRPGELRGAFVVDWPAIEERAP